MTVDYDKKKLGFTLIELLVVISIIALLMSIMLPALTKVRGLAKKTVCTSNMRQWGIACSMYVSDNNGMFPSRFWRNDDGSITPYHNGLPYYLVTGRINLYEIFVKPYIQDYELTFCPSRPQEVKDWETQIDETERVDDGPIVQGHYGLYVGSIVIGDWLNWGPEPRGDKKFIPPLAAYKAPSRMAITGCMVRDNCAEEGKWEYFHPYKAIGTEEPQGGPAAFADGSASFVKYDDMVIFQEYTYHYAHHRYWWPDPKH